MRISEMEEKIGKQSRESKEKHREARRKEGKVKTNEETGKRDNKK